MSRGPRLAAGSLRHLVTIEQVSLAADGQGGGAPTWSTYVTAYARVEPVSAREAFYNSQLQGSVSHKVTLRYQSGIRPGMRVTWGSRTFQIEGVRTEMEELRVMVLDCVEERV